MRLLLILFVLVAATAGSGAIGLGWSIIATVAVLVVALAMAENEIRHLTAEKAQLQAKLLQRDHALQSLLDGVDAPARSQLADRPSGPARST